MKAILCTALMALAIGPVHADSDEALATFKVLKPETAMALAKATLQDCRKRGYQVAVAVVDRFGVVQVIVRDQLAGPHTTETARRKAWTSVSFRSDTVALAEATAYNQPQSGVRHVDQALMLGGGVPVESAGSMVGAVGVSGAPGGELDDECARAGIEAIADSLDF